MNDTKEILSLFEEINQIPRQSRHEERVADFLQKKAVSEGYAVDRDAVNNLIIRVPATKGREDEKIVVFQGHMDMVCEKNNGTVHDFLNDPIKHIIDGDWLKADGTTLGADNGVGLALAFYAAKLPSHPPLEILITVDEETGLNGAQALTADSLKGSILINLDSEDEGIFTIGCAGGNDTRIKMEVGREGLGSGSLFKIEISGLKGGHSGVDINQIRGNALQIICRLLDVVLARQEGARLVELEAGSAHNAIPRNATALVYLPENSEIPVLEKELNELMKGITAETYPGESALLMKTSTSKTQSVSVVKHEDSEKLISLLLGLPHGVMSMSPVLENMVQSSINLAVVKLSKDSALITTSQRSSSETELEFLTLKVWSIARLAGCEAWNESAYPPWPPLAESPLVDRCVSLYKGLFGKEPIVETIHAGLECGIIGSKYPEMEMISLGPTILNPHSPDERLNIPSVGPVWELIKRLMEEKF